MFPLSSSYNGLKTFKPSNILRKFMPIKLEYQHMFFNQINSNKPTSENTLTCVSKSLEDVKDYYITERANPIFCAVGLRLNSYLI